MTNFFQSQAIFQVASDPCKIGVSGKPDDTPEKIYLCQYTTRMSVICCRFFRMYILFLPFQINEKPCFCTCRELSDIKRTTIGSNEPVRWDNFRKNSGSQSPDR